MLSLLRWVERFRSWKQDKKRHAVKRAFPDGRLACLLAACCSALAMF